MNVSKKNVFVKDSVSNFDIYILAHEMNEILKEGFISNVYNLPEAQSKILILKFRSKTGKKYLIVDPKKRINFTDYKYPVPQFPSQFIVSLRKVIKGRRINRVYQHNFDRIIVFELKSSEGPSWKFVIEFFAGGNYVIIDGEGKTYLAQSYKKYRDREILAKKKYEFPQIKGENIWSLDFETFLNICLSKNGQIVRIIARSFNIGGSIAEEVLARASIDKTSQIEELKNQDLKNIFNHFKEIIQLLNEFETSPRVLLNDDNNFIGFDAFEMKTHNQYQFKKVDSLNEAVDLFFSKIDSENLFSLEHKKSSTKLSKQERILDQQLNTIEKSKENREKYLENGNLIYQYLYEIDQLISIIMKQKRENDKNWDEIEKILIQGKKKSIKECQIFEKILPKEMKILVDLNGVKYKLDLLLNATQNAQQIYDKAKNAKRRIRGAKIAAEKTKEKISIQQQKQEELNAQKAILLKEPKRRWFEKFRWFFSSENFLIIAGRDASSNEVLVGKHMIQSDLFLHAEVRGAAVCLIKNEKNKEIPLNTINQAAIFASCYSSAWRNGWGNTKIYYVHPDQVSKTPQSGEYLNKGSFVINGTKNFLPKPNLKIAIGVQLIPIGSQIGNNIDKEENDINKNLLDWNQFAQEQNEDGELLQYFPKIIAAPIEAIQKETKNYVIIKPSNNGLKTSSLAKEILHRFQKQSNKAASRWIKLVPLDNIIRMIPPGNSIIIG